MWLWPLSKGSKGADMMLGLRVMGEACYLSFRRLRREAHKFEVNLGYQAIQVGIGYIPCF